MRLQLTIFIFFISMTNCFSVQASACKEFFGSARTKLFLDIQILKNSNLDFLEHIGPANDPFGSAMAMNVQYSPVVELRQQIQESLKLDKPLNFLKAWDPNGEAHVTTITPVEYFKKLKDFVHITRINQIAKDFDIQSSDLSILGLGSGRLVIDGKTEETYFIIVKSENLLKIRRAIYREFVKAGGQPDSWNPEDFYPHITVGYTLRDLHESDGILKDLEHSMDNRFKIIPRY